MNNKFYLTISLAATLLLFNCKSDKKEPTETPPTVESPTATPPEDIEEVEKDSSVTNEVPTKKETPAPTEKKSDVKKNIASNVSVEGAIKITAIEHASMVLETNGTTIYIDPVGGSGLYKGINPPNFILITDIHGDHLDVPTLEAITSPNTIIIGPRAVKEKLSPSLLKNYELMFNGLSKGFKTSKVELNIDAIPMYNLREEALQFHTKDRGNGYVLSINGTRVYVSGDTEDIPEMRSLKNIDIAFVCMNLPYTMTVESAASAVLDFKPKKVYPYHYRGTEGYSDVKKFKNLVNAGNKTVKVVQLEWYDQNM
ncbi:MBL fold metallo-hydrolase [Mangrovimonas xylaniphaga]|uniref:MBL fold metallo-hydrolase n=1 Tax=Mangrovimonas xylaniphaga TaxID=1645915 RepID=UPI0006B555A6|nr:MBL fold metallo-hydrolase [Mangrovimonas xylaniphaga]